jgi:hypothetical protein
MGALDWALHIPRSAVGVTLAATAGAAVLFSYQACIRHMLTDETQPEASKAVHIAQTRIDYHRLSPYPQDVFPGGRDVLTPYGTIRVYEWGPVDGDKVLLMHGIGTPCVALGDMAHAFIRRGCRVMLFGK